MPYLVVSYGGQRRAYYRLEETASIAASTVREYGHYVSGPTHVHRLPRGARYVYDRKAEQLLHETRAEMGISASDGTVRRD